MVSTRSEARDWISALIMVGAGFSGMLFAVFVFVAAGVPQADPSKGLAVYVFPTFCLSGLALLVLGFVASCIRPYVGLSILVVVDAMVLGMFCYSDISLSSGSHARSIVVLVLGVLGVVGWFKYARRNYFDDSTSIQIERVEGLSGEVDQK